MMADADYMEIIYWKTPFEFITEECHVTQDSGAKSPVKTRLEVQVPYVIYDDRDDQK